ncbi:hypothetical protein AB0D59_44410 [Streptomyces sp. NPDC048417]|uniref:hypothetical protein n=1 Tax=Streptomyces sp. NPDC048417 TaxID=3155387 RepID=UPI0034235591
MKTARGRAGQGYGSDAALPITGETPLAVLARLRDLPHLQLLAQISGDYPIYALVHAPSTAHRVVRRVLDEQWVKPRLEVVSDWLGFETPFVLRLRVAPGDTPEVMRRIDRLPQTRLAAHVASDMSVLCTGLVTDRSALASFIDGELARIPGILAVGVDVMLAEPRRYWLDRDRACGLGDFHAPELL